MMREHVSVSLYALVCLGAGASACSGLDTGNANLGRVELALAADDSDPIDQAGNTFTLTTARARVRHVELYLPAGASCAGVAGCDGDKIRVDGPWDIDLLTGDATPALPRVEVPLGTYRRVDVRFEPDDGDVTLAVSGTVLFRGAPTPFTLALDFNETARFESATGFVVTRDVVQDAVARLAPATWFAALPLVACADDGDLPIEGGTIVITDGDGSCSDVESVVRDAIKGSGRLED